MIHFLTSPTVNLTCLWFLYLCYCINRSRLNVLPNVPPCDIGNIFSVVLCDQSPLVPQFWFLSGHGHLTLTIMSFANFVLPILILLHPEMFLDVFMTFMHRKLWYNFSMKSPTSCDSTTGHHLPKHTASLCKAVQTHV